MVLTTRINHGPWEPVARRGEGTALGESAEPHPAPRADSRNSRLQPLRQQPGVEFMSCEEDREPERSDGKGKLASHTSLVDSVCD
jgi:hypothetical protein